MSTHPLASPLVVRAPLLNWFSENFGDQSGVFACENLDWSPKFSLNDKTLTGPNSQDATEGVNTFRPPCEAGGHAGTHLGITHLVKH